MRDQSLTNCRAPQNQVHYNALGFAGTGKAICNTKGWNSCSKNTKAVTCSKCLKIIANIK